MLTVASPLEDATTIAVRAHAVEQALLKNRKQRHDLAGATPVSIVYCFPESVPE